VLLPATHTRRGLAGSALSRAYQGELAIAPLPAPARPLDVQAVDRRAALGLLAAAAAVSTAQPSEAAYGDAARVFAGKVTNKSGAWLAIAGAGRARQGRSGSTAPAAGDQPPAPARRLPLSLTRPPPCLAASPPVQALSPMPARASRCCCPAAGTPPGSRTSPALCSGERR
jgi:hypothetical protein